MQFAAVLNEKKAKAIEWKQKAEQAQESVQRAGNEVNLLLEMTLTSWPASCTLIQLLLFLQHL